MHLLEIPEKITPAEAIKIFTVSGPLESIERAKAISDVWQNPFPSREADFDKMCLHGCIWNAGRVQGFREARAVQRNRTEDAKDRLADELSADVILRILASYDEPGAAEKALQTYINQTIKNNI